MTKQIRVKLNYGTLNDKDVATLGVAVVDGLTNHLRHLSIILCLRGGRNSTYKAVRPALTH